MSVKKVKAVVEKAAAQLSQPFRARFAEFNTDVQTFYVQHADVLDAVDVENIIIGQDGIDLPFPNTCWIFNLQAWTEHDKVRGSVDDKFITDYVVVNVIRDERIRFTVSVLKGKECPIVEKIFFLENGKVTEEDFHAKDFLNQIIAGISSSIMWMGYDFLLKALGLLACDNVATEEHRDKVGRKTLSGGRKKESYHVLKVRPGRSKSTSTNNGNGKSPRGHFRRGHVRRIYNEDRTVKRRVFVSPCLVNGKDFLEKDYVL